MIRTIYSIEYEKNEIRAIFTEAAREISDLPSGLQEIGLDLLNRCDPSRNGGTSNEISYLLPYWVRELTESPINLCRDMAIGNVFAMLHFFLLDDAMDGGEGRGRIGLRGSLALGQLLHELFLQRYTRHFPPASPLWSYYRKYLQEWASAVYREDKTPADPYDSVRLAHKAAPVKLCAVGLLLWNGQVGDIPGMEEAIELALAVLQLSDDWGDWLRDLAEPDTNAFLSLVRERLAQDMDVTLNESMVKKAIYQFGCLERLAAITKGYAARLRCLPIAPPQLIAFQSAIVHGIHRDMELAQEWTTKLATGGGFAQFLDTICRKL